MRQMRHTDFNASENKKTKGTCSLYPCEGKQSIGMGLKYPNQNYIHQKPAPRNRSLVPDLGSGHWDGTACLSLSFGLRNSVAPDAPVPRFRMARKF